MSSEDSDSLEERNKIPRLKHFQREHLLLEYPLNLKLLSKTEFIISQKNEIQIYKINKNKTNKINSIKIKENIKDFIIINNNIVLSTDKGYIIIFEKIDENKYKELKKIKFKDNQIYYNLLDLKYNNLICGFTLDSLNIIDIKNGEIVSFYKISQESKKKGNKDSKISKITEETFDPRSRPFIIKNPKTNNYLICFKLINYFIVLNYKNMRIIKKVNLENYFSFQLYKPDNIYQYFYIILLNKEIDNNLIIQKYSSNLKIIESYKTKFSFPIPHFSMDDEEGSEYGENDYDLIGDDECIFKCIIEDTKNFIFLYHAYWGPPNEYEIFTLYNYKKGKKVKKTELGYSFFNCDEPRRDYEIKDISKNKIIISKGNQNIGIEDIKINNI